MAETRWVLTTAEPTEEMVNIIVEKPRGRPNVYRAMLAAAPDPLADEALVEQIARKMCCPRHTCTKDDWTCMWEEKEADARAVIALLKGAP